MENNFDVINGFFLYTVYKSETYMVSKFEAEEGTITVTGPSFDYVKSDKYTLTGEYVEHPKYGFQFNIIGIAPYIPDKKTEIIKFLSSASFKGVGKKAASKIYNAYGDDCLRIIKNDMSLLADLDLTEKQIISLKTGLEALGNELNETVFLLITAGFTSKEANLIYNYYKDETPIIIKDDPYKVYLDIYGMSFNKVVEVAKGYDFEDKELKFKRAYLVYIFKEYSFRSGDTYLFEEDFRFEYDKYYNDFDEVLNKCLKEELLIKEDNRLYLASDYYDEKYIADYFKAPKESLNKDDLNIEAEIKLNEDNLGIKFDSTQIEAISSFFKEDLSLIIGGPGTGKTTLIKTLVTMFDTFYPFYNVMVIAPTGRAAKRINEICGVESKTIHSLLRWNKDSNTFIHTIGNPIMYDCLIIDEFSMVDNNLFASLLKACLYVKKICIIGDDNQLPSIRQGNVLRDLIDSRCFKTTYLKTNHRQKNGNDIISLANDIVNDNVDFKAYKKDIDFIDINNFGYTDLINLIKEDINNGIDLDDIQILSPMYRGEFGIDNLNVVLQNAFNPKEISKKEHKANKFIYRENDKILQLKNRPNDDVYNGDIGVLEEIDDDEKCFVINFSGTKVFYNFDDLSDISLAYCLSVHKSQGSEYKVVYFMVSNSHINMLYKKLIYTAISRAKLKLVIIGDKNTFMKGINKELNNRKTSLLSRLIAN